MKTMCETSAPISRQIGERLRDWRTTALLSRRELAELSGVSERHLANIERGSGNPSVSVLAEVCTALGRSFSDLTSEQDYEAAISMMSAPNIITLVGARAAGKSLVGKMLANELDVPFVEMTRLVEVQAGCVLADVFSLYDLEAYRRFERRAIDDVLNFGSDLVVAAPDRIIYSDSNYSLIREKTISVWLDAKVDVLMQRRTENGLAPAGSEIDSLVLDLQRLLDERRIEYAKASIHVDTTGKTAVESFASVRQHLELFSPKPKKIIKT